MAAATTAPGTAAAATTDDAPTRRSGWSVRTRIISAVVLLVLLALTGAGALVYVVEYNRLQEQAVARIDQELDEFAALDQEGIDPETGEAFVDVRALLTTFLQRNVPDENEVLVAWFGGRPREAIPGEDSYVTRRGDFEQTVEEMLADGGTRHVEVPSYGEAMLTVQSVQAGNDAGALVIVTYLERDRAELRSTMQTYAAGGAALARRHHGGRRLAVRPAAGPAAHPPRDGGGDHRDRPLPTDPGDAATTTSPPSPTP